jgi:hypothetical protein
MYYHQYIFKNEKSSLDFGKNKLTILLDKNTKSPIEAAHENDVTTRQTSSQY